MMCLGPRSRHSVFCCWICMCAAYPPMCRQVYVFFCSQAASYFGFPRSRLSRQGFECKLFILEVISENTGKGVGEGRQEREDDW